MLKLANPLLAQPAGPPAPPTPGPPAPPANLAPPSRPAATPTPGFDALALLNPVALANRMGDLKLAPTGYDDVAKATATVPPLTRFTPRLGSFQGTADTALKFVQRGLQSKAGPQTFAGLLGAVGRPVVGGLLATPAGLPALAGLHGLLAGGESFAAANTLFRPLLDRVGL